MAAAAAQSSTTRRLDIPQRTQIARAAAPIVDREVAASSVSAVAPAGYWGGQYQTAAGESVTIYASNSYPVDPALGQRWADFLGSLVHGSEISTVTVLLATAAQISRVCGADAVACYSPQGAVLYTPGEDPGTDLSAEAVITHEYGHHVAANRSDAPWSALDSGPKRWASTMQVCARTRSGELFPGAEDAQHYTLNPGEGWAETYRVLNERKAGLAEAPWQIVTQALYPTAAALTAAEQDVTSPWQAATTTTDRGPEPDKEDPDLYGHDTPRRNLQVDAQAFGTHAARRRRLRIVDSHRPCGHRGRRLTLLHGLRDSELPRPGHRAGRTWLRQPDRCEALTR